MAVRSLPFTMSDAFEGLAETYGIAAVENGVIALQFQTKDAIIGAIKSGIKDVQIPVENLEEISFNKSIWGHKVTMRVNDLALVQDIPGQSTADLKLSTARKDADQAIDFVRAIRLDQSEREYNKARASFG